MKMLTVNRE